MQEDPNVQVRRTEGFGAGCQAMYFGDNSDDVRNSSSGLLEPATIHTPGQLEMDRTYDWHRDESDVITPHRVKLWHPDLRY